MATASDKLEMAIPGPGWTLPKLTELAQGLIEEVGDLAGYELYSLLQLPGDAQVAAALPGVLAEIRRAYWEAKNEPPPEVDENYM